MGTRYTYDDLQAFPEDNLRREIIDGELIVTAAPATRHQRVVATLVARLYAYAEAHGGQVLPAPTDVFFSDTNVVEPDVIYIRPEHLERMEKTFIRSAPDLGSKSPPRRPGGSNWSASGSCTSDSACPSTGSSTWMLTGSRSID